MFLRLTLACFLYFLVAVTAQSCQIEEVNRVNCYETDGFNCIAAYCCWNGTHCYKHISSSSGGDTEGQVGAAGRLPAVLLPSNPQPQIPAFALTNAAVQFRGSCLFHCTSIPRQERVPCGGGPTSMNACLGVGCCYDASELSPTKKCFFSAPSIRSCPPDRCLAPSGSLKYCANIDYAERVCLALGCCSQMVGNNRVCYFQEDAPRPISAITNNRPAGSSSSQVVYVPQATQSTAAPTTTATTTATTTPESFLQILSKNGGVLEEYSVMDLLSNSISQLLRKRNRTVTTTPTPRPTTTKTTTTAIPTTTRQPRVLTTQPAFVFRSYCRWGRCRRYRVRNPSLQRCYPRDCGKPRFYPGSPISLPSSTKKIVGGTSAYPFSHPWTVMIEKKERKKQFLCGGSIICKHWIVTAAHCFNRQTQRSQTPDLDALFYTVYVGRFMGLKYSAGKQVQTFRGRKDIDFIEIHDKFRSGVIRGVVAYDIAVMRLKQPIEFNNYAQPVCMPTVRARANQIVWATGWGETKGVGKSNQNLKQLGVKILNETVCQRQVPKFNVTRPPGVLCAGGESKQDTCTGDSGGPLVGPKVVGVDRSGRRNLRWTLFGMTSFGSPSCNTFNFDRQPAVYTDVMHYKDWINMKTNYCCD